MWGLRGKHFDSADVLVWRRDEDSQPWGVELTNSRSLYWATAALMAVAVVTPVSVTALSGTGGVATGSMLGLVAVLAVLALFPLRWAFALNAERIRSLSERAELAEEAVRLQQERMHELRATVSDISKASYLLSRRSDESVSTQRARIEQMMTSELSRLERLLDTNDLQAPLRPVLLDDLIEPLVVCQQELGTPARWTPTQTWAIGRPDEIVQALHILLSNAHRHAPGAPVEVRVEDGGDRVRIVVHDRGPGISNELSMQIFERGVRSTDSQGEGLGLYTARRLLVEQCGTLELRQFSSAGTEFVIELPSASRPIRPIPRQRSSFQRVG